MTKEKGVIMLTVKKIKKQEFFIETDTVISEKFAEAGFGRRLGSELLLTPLEAAYLANIKKTAFSGMTLDKFLASRKKKDGDFMFTFKVYAIIRGGGRILVPAGDAKDYFRVYAPGIGRPENRPSQLLRIIPGADISPKSIKEEVEIAHRERLELIVAVGTEAEPKFYKISAYNF